MQIIFSEQDVRDSVYVYVANLRHVAPQDIEDVELHYVPNFGFSAKAIDIVGGTTFTTPLNEQQIIDAVAFYLSSYYSFDMSRLQIELFRDDLDSVVKANILVV